MQDPRRQLPNPPSSLVLTVTATTQELKTPQYVEQLLQPFTSYQLIPAPLTLNYNAEQVLLAALPYTSHKLVDLTLPYVTQEESSS